MSLKVGTELGDGLRIGHGGVITSSPVLVPGQASSASGRLPGNQDAPKKEVASVTTDTTQQDTEAQSAEDQKDQQEAASLETRLRRLCAVASNDKQSPSGVMDTDYVRPSQMQEYIRFLQESEEGKQVLDEIGEEDLRKLVHQRGGFPRAQSDKLRELMTSAKLAPSHVWVKGVAAAYIALELEGREELPPDPEPAPEPTEADEATEGDEGEEAPADEPQQDNEADEAQESDDNEE